MKCPCCGVELGLVQVEGRPVIEEKPLVVSVPLPSPPEVHEKWEVRWAVAQIKHSPCLCFFKVALFRGLYLLRRVFSSSVALCTCLSTIGLTLWITAGILCYWKNNRIFRAAVKYDAVV